MISHHTDTIETATMSSNIESFHNLSNKWTLWAHLPHNTDWSIKSYIPISTFTTIEETLAVTETMPSILVENCMLFMMKEGIKPTWEDPKNRNGGCFSFKVTNKVVPNVWRNLYYALCGETLFLEQKYNKHANGITISPKKNFCIIKIWLDTAKYQDPNIIIDIPNLSKQGCLFKKHEPEF